MLPFFSAAATSVGALCVVALTIGCGSRSRPAAPVGTPAPNVDGGAADRAACFTSVELATGRVTREGVPDGDACAVRRPPASTFKIPHALIALETAVVTDPYAMRRWNGEHYRFASWERDHSLASAIEHSVVWFFQRTAVEIGRERMQRWLTKLDYGDSRIGDDLTHFWLEGPLAISADEQLRFVRALYRDELAFSAANMATVRKLLVKENGVVINAVGEHRFATPWPAGATLSGKTGWAENANGSTLWFVGHLATTRGAWVFASVKAWPAGAKDVDGEGAIGLASRSLHQLGAL